MLLKLQVYQKQNAYTPPTVGADWVPSLKPYILDSRTIIATAHKFASPQTNDLVYQLRQKRKEKVILAGMLANVCVESHMRDLIENGFQTAKQMSICKADFFTLGLFIKPSGVQFHKIFGYLFNLPAYFLQNEIPHKLLVHVKPALGDKACIQV